MTTTTTTITTNNYTNPNNNYYINTIKSNVKLKLPDLFVV